MSVNNLTTLNDAENITGWTDSNKTPTLVALAGYFYEGSNAVQTQHSDTTGGNELDTTQTSGGGGTFSVDMSDRTFYFLVKDNLIDSYANQGIMAVFGDGTDKVGFQCGGNDAVGMPLKPLYNAYKFDCSNLPSGSNTTFTGTEGNLTFTAITAMGMGTVHPAKAQGNVNNVFVDKLSYISNGSYALTINGGTSGTPETMADVQGDDETNGWGLVGNPLASQFIFFAPTEWGNATTVADHYFTADSEQWYWVGDNSGGHAVGATHFPFRVISNATDTGSFVITSVVIINTGTGAEFDCESTNVETLEIDLCSFDGLASFNAPSAGGTSRFCTNTTISNSGQVTHNGASMNGCSILSSTVVAGSGALLYNETADPDGEMDDMTFTQGATAHSAIEFGTSVTNGITLRGIDFTGFGSTDDVNGAVFKFLATSGSLNLNLVGCTTDGTFSVDDTAGIAVTVVINPVTETVNVKDTSSPAVNIQNARVFVETAETIGGGEIFEASVSTLTSSAGVATCTMSGAHGLVTGDKVVVRGAQPDEYNRVATVTVTSTTVFTYTVPTGISSPATGTPVVSFVVLSGLTDVSGNISASRTWTANQPVKGWARKTNASSPFYKEGQISYDIDSTNGNTTNVVLQPDE